MPEPETADALGEQIDAATAAGDLSLANRLYRRQIGTEGLVEEPSPAAVPPGDVEGDTDPPAASQALTVATGADDEIVQITGGMDYANNAASVTQALDAMKVWGEDEVAGLQAKWGSDMGANLSYFEAFALAHPDVHEILVATGFGDHPAIVEVGAILGRKYATEPGDPGRITTTKTGATGMANTEAIETQIDDLQDQIEKAQWRHDTRKANALYARQQALYGQLPGGGDQVVGSSGGPTS